MFVKPRFTCFCKNIFLGNYTMPQTVWNTENVSKWTLNVWLLCSTAYTHLIIYSQEAKESFASPNYLFYCSGHTVELGWPEVHSILLTGCPAFSQGTFCHFWMAGVGVTCDQPKGVKLGISNIPNYKDSLMNWWCLKFFSISPIVKITYMIWWLK